MGNDEAGARDASIDSERLLPGENPAHPQPGDAEHWVSVYTELISTVKQRIAGVREMMEQQSNADRDELERADIRMLELQVERFELQLAVWRSKMATEDVSVVASDSPHEVASNSMFKQTTKR